MWLDPNDPATQASVISGAWCAGPAVIPGPPGTPDETALLALQVASDLLLRLTGFLVHPAGVAIDDFRCTPSVHRLTPNYRPIREVQSIYRVLNDCTQELMSGDACVHGQDVYFSRSQCTLASYYMDVCSCRPLSQEIVRLTYRFGSTITPAARRAVIYLAHQLWLECNPDQGECLLPDRTTSVNREGLSYTIFDPQSFLGQFKTGLPSVDLWLSSVNPGKALRPTGIWTPDSAPAVNVGISFDWKYGVTPPVPVP